LPCGAHMGRAAPLGLDIPYNLRAIADDVIEER
jgi:hypothetical protein